jgi:hypothetical protein
MGEGTGFQELLRGEGFDAELESIVTSFSFDTFEHAWDVLAGVTCVGMTESQIEAAQHAVREEMWPKDGGPRIFSNLTHYLTATKR